MQEKKSNRQSHRGTVHETSERTASRVKKMSRERITPLLSCALLLFAVLCIFSLLTSPFVRGTEHSHVCREERCFICLCSALQERALRAVFFGGLLLLVLPSCSRTAVSRHRTSRVRPSGTLVRLKVKLSS